MAQSAAEKTELQIVAAPAIEKRIFVVRERQIFEALRHLIAPPPSTKRPVGFRVREGDE